jgi:hypothetical protein
MRALETPNEPAPHGPVVPGQGIDADPSTLTLGRMGQGRFRRIVPGVKPVAVAAVGSAVLIVIAMLLIFGLLPAALVAAGT